MQPVPYKPWNAVCSSRRDRGLLVSDGVHQSSWKQSAGSYQGTASSRSEMGQQESALANGKNLGCILATADPSVRLSVSLLMAVHRADCRDDSLGGARNLSSLAAE